MANRCRSTIGKRPANTTCDTSHLILTDENGASAKVEQSTRNLTSCDPCTSGVRRSSRMRSRCDQPEIEPAMAPPRFLLHLVRRAMSRDYQESIGAALQRKREFSSDLCLASRPTKDRCRPCVGSC